jgi:hypothetical protein
MDIVIDWDFYFIFQICEAEKGLTDVYKKSQYL